MSQSRSADAVPAGAVAAQRTTGPALALRNWRVARQLIVLVAIPAVLILALTGLRVTDAARSAEAYGQVGRLAALGQQVGGLAQAMADERSGTAVFISGGRPAAGLPALRRQYAITDGRAARVRRLVSQLGHGYPAQTRAGAAQALASIARLPGLRRQAAQSQTSALAAITGYSAAISGLFPVNDSIADLSGNSTLITSVRALGSLSRMIDHASQQQAILGVALAGGRFGPGALTALTIAQAQQSSDLASFRSSATPEESQALTETSGSPAGPAGAGGGAAGHRGWQWRAGPRSPGQPAVVRGDVLHGRLDGPGRTAAGGVDHSRRPGPAAERYAVRDNHRRRGAWRPGSCPAGHHLCREVHGAPAEAAGSCGRGRRRGTLARQRCLRPLPLAQPFAAGTAAPADRQFGTERRQPGTAGQPVRDGPSGHPDLAQLRQRARPRRPRDPAPGRAAGPG